MKLQFISLALLLATSWAQADTVVDKRPDNTAGHVSGGLGGVLIGGFLGGPLGALAGAGAGALLGGKVQEGTGQTGTRYLVKKSDGSLEHLRQQPLAAANP